MSSPLDRFGKHAQHLSRNPLGIIALFIVLVYGIAALVLGFSAHNLEKTEKLPLIWFMVVFPILILLAFYLLVAYHHVKLYSPDDFQDKEGFFRALSPLSPMEQRQRLEEDLQTTESEAEVENDGAAMNSNQIASSSETQKDSIVRSILARDSYVLAEELASREIENEFGVSVHRNVAISRKNQVDGLFYLNNKPVVVEIKYKRLGHIPDTSRKVISQFARIRNDFKHPVAFIFVLVIAEFSIEREERAIKQFQQAIAEIDIPPEVQIRVYDFAELREKYGITNANIKAAVKENGEQ